MWPPRPKKKTHLKAETGEKNSSLQIKQRHSCYTLIQISFLQSKVMDINVFPSWLDNSIREPILFFRIQHELVLRSQRKQKHLGRNVCFTVVDQKYLHGYKKCRQLTMGGATDRLGDSFTNLWHWLKVTADKKHFPGRSTQTSVVLEKKVNNSRVALYF